MGVEGGGTFAESSLTYSGLHLKGGGMGRGIHCVLCNIFTVTFKRGRVGRSSAESCLMYRGLHLHLDQVGKGTR